MVPENAYLADVGSDHALLPISLVEKGKIEWAEAIENKMGPFLRMQDSINKAGLSNHISSMLADGIAKLNDGVDTVVIAGIGGMLACDILESHPENLGQIKTIILDPHRDLITVRQRISSLGYHIVDEELVYEDKIYYSILKFEKGDAPVMDSYDLTFGPIIRQKKGKVYAQYLLEQKAKLNILLNKGLPQKQRDHYLELYRMVRDELKGLDAQSDSK